MSAISKFFGKWTEPEIREQVIRGMAEIAGYTNFYIEMEFEPGVPEVVQVDANIIEALTTQQLIELFAHGLQDISRTYDPKRQLY